MNEAPNISDVETIKHLQALTKEFATVPSTAEGVVIIPSNMKAEDISKYLPPPRIRQRVVLLEASSFADYVNRFKTEATVLFAEVTDTGAKFTARLDYHAPAPALTPSRTEHVAVFEAVKTREWADWCAANGKHLSQLDFATWLEEHQKLLVTPPGAELKELVENLHGTANVRFKSAIRLDNGSKKIEFEKDVQVRGAQLRIDEASVALPTEIEAGISLFQGCTPFKVKARLKHDIQEHRLFLWFETMDAHLMVREELTAMMKMIAEKTGIIPFIGSI